MTFLDNTVALKQLGEGHKVGVQSTANIFNIN